MSPDDDRRASRGVPGDRTSGERDVVRFLRQALGERSAELIGDDAALVELEGRQVLTVDSQIEGVHFRSGLDEATLARRLLAVNLSDLAAAGADPLYGLLALSVPSGFDHRRFFEALGEQAADSGVTVAGGDLARSPVAILTLTLVGNLPEGRTMPRRSVARPGDRLWIGGPLGLSALGRHLLDWGARWVRGEIDLSTLDLPDELQSVARECVRRHLLPEPQLELGRALSQLPRVAALDVSDGLALDLDRLLEASGVGAEIEAGELPIPAEARALAEHLELDALELALTGGEDYGLLFALPEDSSPPLPGPTPIGRVLDPGIGPNRALLRTIDGLLPLVPIGWDHLETL